MGVSVDGFIADREGAFGWTVPTEEEFRLHIAHTRELSAYLSGRRLYETMLVWETDPSLRETELGAAFDPDAVARRMAGLLDLDPQRVRRWLFARCAQESLHDLTMRDLARRLAP